MKSSLRSLKVSATLAFLAAMGTSLPAEAIMIDFNDYTGLYWIDRQARDTFAWSSTDNGSGAPVRCNGASWCWEYAQPTVDNANNFYWFYVADWNETTGTGNFHYHLGFEDPTLNEPTLNCYSDGAIGRNLGGTCVLASDYAAEPRYVLPHQWNYWVQFSTMIGREFYASSLWNRGTAPIQVWIFGGDFNWYYVDNLDGETNWGLTWFGAPAEVLQVDVGPASSYGGQEGPIALDDLMIDYVPL